MQPSNDIVVLLHGIAGTPLDMWRIARRLRRRGFDVRNWGYRSLGNDIQTHAQALGQLLAELDLELISRSTTNKIHLVTHSMGGIIARAALAEFQIQHLHRVVMLAPPHQGSHAARKLTPFLGWLSPSLNQLSDTPDSFVNQLPNSFQQNGIEFGIIEAKKDRVIAAGKVHLDGYCDYAYVNGQHGILTWYSRTVDLVETFLINGSFQTAASPSETEFPTTVEIHRSNHSTRLSRKS